MFKHITAFLAAHLMFGVASSYANVDLAVSGGELKTWLPGTSFSEELSPTVPLETSSTVLDGAGGESSATYSLTNSHGVAVFNIQVEQHLLVDPNAESSIASWAEGIIEFELNEQVDYVVTGQYWADSTAAYLYNSEWRIRKVGGDNVYLESEESSTLAFHSANGIDDSRYASGEQGLFTFFGAPTGKLGPGKYEFAYSLHMDGFLPSLALVGEAAGFANLNLTSAIPEPGTFSICSVLALCLVQWRHR